MISSIEKDYPYTTQPTIRLTLLTDAMYLFYLLNILTEHHHQNLRLLNRYRWQEDLPNSHHHPHH